jgi:hypothetical protein
MMGGQLPEGFIDKTGNVYSRDQEGYQIDEKSIQRRKSPESYQLYLDALERGDY